MSRVSIHPQPIPAASEPLLARIGQAFGATSNRVRAVSGSPAALHGARGVDPVHPRHQRGPGRSGRFPQGRAEVIALK